MIQSNVITFADPGRVNPRELAVGELSAAWGTNNPARCSFTLPSRTAASLGDLKGKWIFVPCGPCGNWAGTIEDDPGDIGNQTVELNAVDMTGLFDHVTTARTYQQDAGSPGTLMLRAIRDSGVDNELWLSSYFADEDGLPITQQWRGDQLGRVLSSLASNGGGLTTLAVGDDWTLDWSYIAEPIDRRRDVLLVDGYNAVDGSTRPSISQLVNDLLGVANDSAWQKASGARVVDGDSVAAYGRRQDTRRYVGHTKPSSLEAVARADLKRLAKPLAAVSLEIPKTDPVVRTLVEGQAVTYWSGTTNARYDLTITGRAYDSSRGSVTIVGTAVPS